MLRMFNMCLNDVYNHTDNAGDYSVTRSGNGVVICFQHSNGLEDWKNNFDFPVKPYKDMGVKWYCHRGFLKVWKSIEPYICPTISDSSIEWVAIVGYSHGGALATLCHEYVWYHRPDLRGKISTYAFGSPRCFWGIMAPKLKKRWEGLTVIRNGNDIVTHLPPILFGFRHTTKNIIKLERANQYEFTKFKPINDHYAYNYKRSIAYYESRGAMG